jgi:hypothetical protein
LQKEDFYISTSLGNSGSLEKISGEFIKSRFRKGNASGSASMSLRPDLPVCQCGCSGGTLRAEVLDTGGNPIEPFTMVKSIPVGADSPLAAVAWEGPIYPHWPATAGALLECSPKTEP